MLEHVPRFSSFDVSVLGGAVYPGGWDAVTKHNFDMQEEAARRHRSPEEEEAARAQLEELWLSVELPPLFPPVVLPPPEPLEIVWEHRLTHDLELAQDRLVPASLYFRHEEDAWEEKLGHDLEKQGHSLDNHAYEYHRHTLTRAADDDEYEPAPKVA